MDKNARTKTSWIGGWWLRSAGYSDDCAAIVLFDGNLANILHVYSNEVGVSPAFNINLSSAIFSSLIPGEANAYKLTIKDGGLTATGTEALKDGKPTITYSATGEGATQASYVVTDKAWDDKAGRWPADAEMIAYGRLGDAGSDQTAEFILPEGRTLDGWGTDYHVCVLAEAVSAGNATDYASVPAEVPAPATAPTVTGPADLRLTYGYAEGGVSVAATAAADTEYELTYQWYSIAEEGDETGTPIDGAAEPGYAIPTGKSAETTERYYCVVTAKRTDNGQTARAASGVATVTVAKADSRVTKAPAATNPTYSGRPQALVTAGEAEGGTMQYSLDGEAFSEKVPTGTDARAYDVWYRVKGDDNHSDTEAQRVTSTITKKAEPKPDPKPVTYKVTLTGGRNATAAGAKEQAVEKGKAMATVTFAARAGYHFEGYAGETRSGVTARLSGGKVTVSGTPTADVVIAVPDAVADKKPAPTPAPTPTPEPGALQLSGSGHAQGTGDVAAEASGRGIRVGTTGQRRRLERLSVSLPEGTDGSLREQEQGTG